MKVSDILVPIDFSPSSLKALDYATTLLEPEGEIYLLHVVDTELAERFEKSGLGKSSDAVEKMRAQADAAIDEILDERKGPDGKFNKMIVVGSPFVEILRISKDLDFSLVVMGIRGDTSPVQELFFGSTTDKVIRGTKIPVVCVPA